MKMIMFQEHEAKQLLDLLKLECMEKDIVSYCVETYEEWNKIPDNCQKSIVEKLHRKFHYRVCDWLQKQGASCI